MLFVRNVDAMIYSFLPCLIVLASSDASAKLWSMTNGEVIQTYQGHHKAVVCCALNDGAEVSSA